MLISSHIYIRSVATHAHIISYIHQVGNVHRSNRRATSVTSLYEHIEQPRERNPIHFSFLVNFESLAIVHIGYELLGS